MGSGIEAKGDARVGRKAGRAVGGMKGRGWIGGREVEGEGEFGFDGLGSEAEGSAGIR